MHPSVANQSRVRPRGHLVATLPFALALAAPAQAPVTSLVEPLANGLGRLTGMDASSGIAYTRLFLSAATATPALPVPPAQPPDLNAPTLIVQCTRPPAGKPRLELFVNFGGIPDPAFYPPWRSSGPRDLFPPRTEKVLLTLEFLGYTHVKPVKREFEKVLQPWGQLRYNSPRLGSANLEEITFYFRYLHALPTLRLTGEGHRAEFATGPLLAQVSSEPLCKATAP